jgi:hypothetical protein
LLVCHAGIHCCWQGLRCHAFSSTCLYLRLHTCWHTPPEAVTASAAIILLHECCCKELCCPAAAGAAKPARQGGTALHHLLPRLLPDERFAATPARCKWPEPRPGSSCRARLRALGSCTSTAPSRPVRACRRTPLPRGPSDGNWRGLQLARLTCMVVAWRQVKMSTRDGTTHHASSIPAAIATQAGSTALQCMASWRLVLRSSRACDKVHSHSVPISSCSTHTQLQVWVATAASAIVAVPCLCWPSADTLQQQATSSSSSSRWHPPAPAPPALGCP